MCRSCCYWHTVMWTHHAGIEATALIACLPAHPLQADDPSALGIFTACTWLPHWRLPACGWLVDGHYNIHTLSLYCATLQHHVWRTIGVAGPHLWNDLPKDLRNTWLSIGTLASAFVIVWFLCAAYKCSYLLTYLLTY